MPGGALRLGPWHDLDPTHAEVRDMRGVCGVKPRSNARELGERGFTPLGSRFCAACRRIKREKEQDDRG